MIRITRIAETKLLKPLQTASLFKEVSLPPGEDDTSFKRNNSTLIAECRKGKPNQLSVQSLLVRTFNGKGSEMYFGRLSIFNKI